MKTKLSKQKGEVDDYLKMMDIIKFYTDLIETNDEVKKRDGNVVSKIGKQILNKKYKGTKAEVAQKRIELLWKFVQEETNE